MYYKRLIIDDTEYPLAVNITGSGAPTESTEGEIGMLYMNTDNGELYKYTSDGWKSVVEETTEAVLAKLPYANGVMV